MLSAKSFKCHKSAQFPLILFLYMVVGRETLSPLSSALAPHNTTCEFPPPKFFPTFRPVEMLLLEESLSGFFPTEINLSLQQFFSISMISSLYFTLCS